MQEEKTIFVQIFSVFFYFFLMAREYVKSSLFAHLFDSI